MQRSLITLATALELFSFSGSPADAQDAAAKIKDAEYALGMIRGPRRIDAIATMEFWGTGYT